MTTGYEIITTDWGEVYHVVLSGLNEESALAVLDSIESNIQSKDSVFGYVFNLKKFLITPKVRKRAQNLADLSKEKGSFVGAVLFGQNSFMRMLAKIIDRDVQFVNDFDSAITTINKMASGELPNHLKN